MQFKPLYLDQPERIRETYRHLSFNLFKIAYFLEDDQFEVLSREFEDPKQLAYIVNNYHEVAQTTVIYLRIMNAFIRGHFTFPENQEYFDEVVNFFTEKEKELANYEVTSMDKFWAWIESDDWRSLTQIV